MNYTELKANIEDICETTFTADQLAMFTEQAEQLIYNAVQIPALRKSAAGAVTSGNSYFSTPSDFLWTYSLAVVDGSGQYHFLLNKDVNFIREAYPAASPGGLPVHYAYFSDGSFMLGPTPDANYVTDLNYGHYPTTIVTAGTTYLGDEFDSALLNGALMQAIRFIKGEADMIDLYGKLYAQSMALLKQLGDGRLREDAYRSGQYRQPVT
jgi:hypothetical protein|tara:strand:+ start:3489 stop:4118 length:630 start_codon:yes stop_codon:yes gene_type:complete